MAFGGGDPFASAVVASAGGDLFAFRAKWVASVLAELAVHVVAATVAVGALMNRLYAGAVGGAAAGAALAFGSLALEVPALALEFPTWENLAGLCCVGPMSHCHFFSSQDSSYGAGISCWDASVYVDVAVVLAVVGFGAISGLAVVVVVLLAGVDAVTFGLLVAGVVDVGVVAAMTLLGGIAEGAGSGGCGGELGWAGPGRVKEWPLSGSSGWSCLCQTLWWTASSWSMANLSVSSLDSSIIRQNGRPPSVAGTELVSMDTKVHMAHVWLDGLFWFYIFWVKLYKLVQIGS